MLSYANHENSMANPAKADLATSSPTASSEPMSPGFSIRLSPCKKLKEDEKSNAASLAVARYNGSTQTESTQATRRMDPKTKG